MLDRRRLEKTSNAPFANDSYTPGLRSAVQNKASAHLLALPAITSCLIALIAHISNNMVKCHSRLHTTAHGAVDEDWRLEKAGARPVLDRRRLEKTSNASFANDSYTPGLRSALQNKASAHLLALPAITSSGTPVSGPEQCKRPPARASSHHKLPHRPNCSHFQHGEML